MPYMPRSCGISLRNTNRQSKHMKARIAKKVVRNECNHHSPRYRMAVRILRKRSLRYVYLHRDEQPEWQLSFIRDRMKKEQD